MNILISCGGTGGHIYPGIAIADKIKKERPDANILFVGTKKGMEQKLVPNAGYEIKGIDAKGIDRKHPLNNVKTLHETLHGGNEAGKILDEFKPDFVIGTGGYVTGPVLLQADIKHIPCYIHEQNAMPGVANRLISTFAKKVFVSFGGTFHYFAHPNRVVLSGNPVRAEFESLNRAKERANFGYTSEVVILVFGGSLGAEPINREAVKLIEKLNSDPRNVKLVFITGNRYYDDIKAYFDEHGGVPSFVELKSYAYNMPSLMCASDIVISRSGAIAVSELCACGRAGILIPSPNVTANHQYYNAKALADQGAAILIEESEINAKTKSLENLVYSLIDDKGKLEKMAECAKKMGTFDAVNVIYNNIFM